MYVYIFIILLQKQNPSKLQNFIKNSMRYTIRLSYDGSTFYGWQMQKSSTSIQEELQKALSMLLDSEICVTGAGRTDTGVNAINYVAHFDLQASGLPFDTAKFIYKLNAILPKAVCVHDIRLEKDDFHARFSALSREYHYFLHRKKDPFADRFSFWCRHPLDMDRMNEAASFLIGEHDFSCFEKTGGNNKTSVCTVFEAKWEYYSPTHVSLMGFPSQDGDYMVFTIRANRFLRNMVRAIVGTLVDVGRGKRDAQWFRELIETGSRSDAGESVPGKALFLSDVSYQ